MEMNLELIGNAVNSLNSASEIAKSTTNLSDVGLIRNKLMEIQNRILEAQVATLSSQSLVLLVAKQNAELMRKLGEVERWETIAGRYSLKDYGGGTFAYEFNSEDSDKEPPHKICPSCFQQQRRAILQYRHRTASQQDLYECSTCSKPLLLGQYQSSRPSVRHSSSDWL